MDKFFFHSGKLGDIIYSLPTIIELGGGTLVSGMTRKETDNIRPLLEMQSYISRVWHHAADPLPMGFINLDKFRHHPDLGKRHIVKVHAEAQGVDLYPEWWKGWLNIPHTLHALSKERYAIISVSPRYRDPLFNWKWEIGYLAHRVDKIYFLGTMDEYTRGPFLSDRRVQYLQTWDLLEAAVFISGARYFSGNQSAALAIRQACGLPYRFEQSPNHCDVRQNNPHETVINSVTRRIFLTALCIKKALRGKQA